MGLHLTHLTENIKKVLAGTKHICWYIIVGIQLFQSFHIYLKILDFSVENITMQKNTKKSNLVARETKIWAIGISNLASAAQKFPLLEDLKLVFGVGSISMNAHG